MLTKMFETKMEEVTEGGASQFVLLTNYYQGDQIKKSKCEKGAGPDRSAYSVFVGGKPEGKRRDISTRHEWMDIK